MVRYAASGIAGAVLAAVLFLATLAVSDFEVSKQQTSTAPGSVAVPSVVGASPDRATARLKALGLDVHTILRGGVVIGPAEVRAQVPRGGTPAPQDATVTLWIEAK